MKKYAVYTTADFDKDLFNLSGAEQDKIEKIFLQLSVNPYVGDAIRYRFFREKRLKEKRIYYLIYEDLKSVLVVAMSGKKDQQKVINSIVNYLDKFKLYLDKLLG